MPSVAPLTLTRPQILAYRRSVQALDERLPWGETSLRRAAWAGLQDSMPRAALLSIHARVDGATAALDDPSLVQVWGPRFSAYVVAARDIALFTLGRLPSDPRRRQRAEDIAARLHAFLDGRELVYGPVGRGLGIHPNALRYAAPTGTVLIRWDGARAPTVRTAPAPPVDPFEARLELARRFLHVFGPAAADGFAGWAGIKPAEGRAAFDALEAELLPARTPIGEAFILAEDEPAFRARGGPPAAARLLPSGDTYFLLQGADRELLVPEPDRRRLLWTPRVWPGAALVSDEIAGTWRRANAVVTVEPWRRLSPEERTAVEAEAASLPLPGLKGPIVVRWVDG
jgi:Winged helix DNA-binding domain